MLVVLGVVVVVVVVVEVVVVVDCLIWYIFCNCGDENTSVRGLPANRSLPNLVACLSLIYLRPFHILDLHTDWSVEQMLTGISGTS